MLLVQVFELEFKPFDMLLFSLSKRSLRGSILSASPLYSRLTRTKTLQVKRRTHHVHVGNGLLVLGQR